MQEEPGEPRIQPEPTSSVDIKSAEEPSDIVPQLDSQDTEKGTTKEGSTKLKPPPPIVTADAGRVGVTRKITPEGFGSGHNT